MESHKLLKIRNKGNSEHLREQTMKVLEQYGSLATWTGTNEPWPDSPVNILSFNEENSFSRNITHLVCYNEIGSLHSNFVHVILPECLHN